MHGVLLAGGEGKRLGLPYNKHMALVYDRMMIEYPAQTIKDMGAEGARLVTTPFGVRAMVDHYGYDINGLRIGYDIQPRPNGPAGALGCTALKGTFPVLCGDTYFDPSPEPSDEPTLYWHEFEGAHNHSVWDPETNTVVEKPQRDLGQRAIVAYYYDERVYDFINHMEPKASGELELVDIHNFYLQNGAQVKEYKGFFRDMGTPDGLLAVANHQKDKS